VLRIRDVYLPDPEFYPSRIRKQQQKRGVKKISSHLFLLPQISQNWKLFLFLAWWRKIFEPMNKELWNFLPQKIVIKLSKNGFGIRDPEKNLFRIPDPGIKKVPAALDISLL
jgi:hypothetical protein